MTEGKPAKATPAAKARDEEKRDFVTTPDLALGNVAEDQLVTVRTTMRPDLDLRVTEAEARDLEAQGLLMEEETDDAR